MFANSTRCVLCVSAAINKNAECTKYVIIQTLSLWIALGVHRLYKIKGELRCFSVFQMNTTYWLVYHKRSTLNLMMSESQSRNLIEDTPL